LFFVVPPFVTAINLAHSDVRLVVLLFSYFFEEKTPHQIRILIREAGLTCGKLKAIF